MKSKTGAYFALISSVCLLATSGSVDAGGLCNTGGPDAFGYTFCSSSDASGPSVAFEDISATGTSFALVDDGEVNVPIGFNFNFYGINRTNLFAVSNGHITFGGGSSGSFTNNCPLAATSPPDGIFPYWDDLDPADDGAFLFTETFAVCPYTGALGASGACMIVQWNDFDRFPGDGVPGGTAGTFQAILFESGHIVYQYDSNFLLDGASGTTAISNDGLANSLTFSCNTPATISNDFAIQFSPPALDADLTVSQTDSPDPVVAGTNLTYTVTVANAGPADATNVVATDTLPAGVTLISTNGCAEDPAGVPTCTLGTIAAGGSASYDVTVGVDADTLGSINHMVSVTATENDPVPGDNMNTESTTVLGEADLSVVMTDSADPVVAGGQFTYTIDVSNAGPSDATAVVVTDMLPANTTLVSTTGCAEDPNGSPTCSVGTITALGSASIDITVQTDLLFEGVLSNTATVSSATTDPNLGNETATEDTTVTAASSDLVLTISNNAATPAMIGDVFEITLDLVNNGPQQNPNVVVTGELSNGLTLESSTGGCAVPTGNTFSWTVGTMNVSDMATCVITASIRFAGNQTLTASASGDVGDPVVGNNLNVINGVIVQALPVPTLGAWAVLLLSLMTVLLAAVSLQRRSRPESSSL